MLLRLRNVAVPALIALSCAGLLTGCEAINTASNTLDRAELCAEALSAAGFNPDLSNPQQSADEAQRRAEELRGLAERTTDPDLERELRSMADQMASFEVKDADPVAAARWARDKLDRLNQLQLACAP